MRPKGQHSNLHNEYSDWHKDLPSWCYMTDLDEIIVERPYIYRLWVEVRKRNNMLLPVAVIDIKRPGGILTKTEDAVYGWLERQGLPVYIVWIDKFETFEVMRYASSEKRMLTEEQYKKFLSQKQIQWVT